MVRSQVMPPALRRGWRRLVAPPRPAPLSTRRAWLLVALFALAVALRLPRVWAHGRFQDEEGTIFFAYAWHAPASAALWRPFAGYLNLGANGVTWAAASLVRAGALPLEYAPYLTMAVALAVQAIPAVLLAFARAPWLADPRYRIAALAIVAIPPLTEEVWLNTLHIQFHLALAAALILALDVPTGWRRPFSLVPLLIAPLCGPGAIVLLPLFVARAGIEREAGRLEQVLALGLGAAIQMAIFYTPTAERAQHLDPATLAAVLFCRLMLLPWLTPPLATPISRWVYAAWAARAWWWVATAAAAAAWFGWLSWRGWAGRGRDGAFWLIASGLALAVASFGAGMLVIDPFEWFSIGSAERYDFLPLVLLALGMLALAARRGESARGVFVAGVLLFLLSGLIGLIGPLRDFRQGPNWAAEVARWRLEHRYQPSGWPADWRLDLTDEFRACPSPRAPASAVDPSYCETAWRARVIAAAASRPPARSAPPPHGRGSP